MTHPDQFPSSPDTARQVAIDAFNAMSEEEQAFLRGIAEEVESMLRLARVYLDKQILDNEETLALWALLPAWVRSALKAAATK